MNTKRSYEVTLAGRIVLGLGLLFSLYFLAFYFFLKHIFSLQSHPAPFPYVRFAISLIMTSGFAIFGIFILRLKDWARIFSLVLMIFWMFMGFVQVREAYAVGSATAAWFDCSIFFLIPAGACLYLVTLPKVIKQFDGGSGRFGGRIKKMVAFTLGSILMILYLSAPYGVWDANSKIGRMVSKLRTIVIPGKAAGTMKAETRIPSKVDEPVVLVESSVQKVQNVEKPAAPRELPVQEVEISTGISKSSLKEKFTSKPQLFQDAKN